MGLLTCDPTFDILANVLLFIRELDKMIDEGIKFWTRIDY